MSNKNYWHLLAEWDESNGAIENYAYCSNKKVKWNCSFIAHHYWESLISNRTKKVSPRGCPICSNNRVCPVDSCNSLYYSNPELRKEWDKEKNGSMKSYLPGSGKIVNWNCSTIDHHSWEACISNRTLKDYPRGCPICANKKICAIDACNSLYHSNPELREEWNNEKNGDMKNYFPNSGKMVSWVCGINQHHEWDAVIGERTGSHKRSCPICTNQKICSKDACNSLYYSNPHLREEWNKDKNGDMKAYTPNSRKMVSWVCSVNIHHEWDAFIYSRTGKQKSACPICTNKKICPKDACNSLYYSNPELRKEWNKKENRNMKEFSPNSGKLVSWICSYNDKHRWLARIYQRTHATAPAGCPYCTYKSEQKCRELLEELLDISFIKCRPPFLKGYELDGYNEKYSLAFEYNGLQHYIYMPYFHRNGIDDFILQLFRDELKRIYCQENNVKLIDMPYTYTHNKPDEMRAFLISELKRLNIPIPKKKKVIEV